MTAAALVSAAVSALALAFLGARIRRSLRRLETLARRLAQ